MKTGPLHIPGIAIPLLALCFVQSSLAQPFTTGMAAGQVLGQANLTTISTTPSQSIMRGPTCVAFSSTGKMAVADASGNRVLIWNSIPTSDGQPADVVIGQTDFTTITSGTTATTLSSPAGAAFSPDGSKLVVSDAVNNRVLVYNAIPTTNGAAADVVIGQTDFTSSTGGTSQTLIKVPVSLLVAPDGRLLIAEQNNNRVLVYNSIPTTNGAAADVVIGQTDFVSTSLGNTSSTLRGPTGLALAPDGRLLVADFGNNRVLIFSAIPTTNGAAAVNVIGQTTLTTDTNPVSPAANNMDGPWGLAISPTGQLAIGDVNDHRVLIFNSVPTTDGASADVVLGQPNTTNDGVYNPGGLPSAFNMNTALAAAFSPDGRIWVPGSNMRRVMVFGTAAPPTDTGATGGGQVVDVRAPTLSTSWAICMDNIYPTFGGGPTSGGDAFAYTGEIRCVGFDATHPNFALMWLPCDGRLVSRTTYANLFSLIGTTFGAGDGATTFALPDLRGRIPVGQDGATLPIGTKGGAESATLGVTNLPNHKHTITGGDTGFTGGGQAYNHQQPFLALNFGVQNAGAFATTIGWIRLFAFPNTVDGFFPCTGGTQPTSLYSALFSLLGTNFGGNGTTNFGIPDLRGRSPIGRGTGPSLTARNVGDTGGSTAHTLTEAEMAAHTHSLSSGSTGSTGGSSSIDQMDPFLALTHGIARVGVFMGSDETQAVGEMRWYARFNVPSDYLQCDGASLSTSTESILFLVLSNAFGGNGTTNFNVPDFRGRFVNGTGQGTGLSNYSRGQNSGAESLALAVNQLPSHTHSLAGTAPEIDVEQPSGTHLVDGVSNLTFGVVNFGSTGTAKVFTITNTGSADLTGLNVTADGNNPGDFVITQPPATTVAPSGYVQFTVAFAPTANLGRNAVLHIASNDADENTFDIGIAGVGNVAPTNITLTPSSVPEGNAGNLTVGTLAAVDPDAFNTHTFTLVTGTGDADNGSFMISGTDLVLVPVPDFETKSSYNIRVAATDQYGLSFEKALVVSIVNKNEPPSFVMGPNQRHPLGTSGAQTVSGWATAIDDGDSTVTQTLNFLVSNDNNGLFTTQPAINATTGTLTYTLNGTSGTATVSVQLQDDNTINGDAPNSTTMQTFTITVDPLPDYQITLTGGALTITDLSGNSDAVTVIENTGEAGSIRFFIPNRTISVNGALNVLHFSPPFALASLTSMTINEGAGSNSTSFTTQITGSIWQMPALTVNGESSNDQVNFNVPMTFNTGASLDLNLQNDGGGTGVDAVALGSLAQLTLSGTGSATIKCSKSITLNAQASVTTVDGDIIMEANQQAVPTPGNFHGVQLNDLCLVRASGSGQVTVKGKSGDTSSGHGVFLLTRASIQGGPTGTLTVVGVGNVSNSPTFTSYGVATLSGATGTGSPTITTTGANIVVTGTAGLSTVLQSAGVWNDGCLISAGGSGTVQVTGNGGPASGVGSYGVYVWQFQGTPNAQITSNGGDVTVIGNGGSGNIGGNSGVFVATTGKITAGGNGNLTVTGTCSGDATGGTSLGVVIQNSTALSVPGTGNITVNGTGGFGSGGGNGGVVFNASVTSQGGNISVTGRGKGQGNTVGCHGITAQGFSTTGTGSITLDGMAAAADTGYGVQCVAPISTAGGGVTITGVGGGGTGSFARGIYLNGAPISGPGAGAAITLNGTGGSTTGDFVFGIELFGTSGLQTSGGDISVTGVAGNNSTVQYANGIMMVANPVIQAGGTGKITINGTGGSATTTFTNGLQIIGGSITTANGDVSITGTAGGQMAAPSSVGISLGTSVTAGGSGNITFTADSMSIGGAVFAVGDTVNFRQRTAGTPLNLGTADVLTGTLALGLAGGEVSSVQCATFNIGNASTGPVTVGNAVGFNGVTSQINITGVGAFNISGGQLSSPLGASIKLDAGGGAVIPSLPFFDVDTVLNGTLSFGSGTQLSIAINGNAFNSGYQVLDLRSRLNLTGVPLVLSGSYTPVYGDSFMIERNESAFPITGTFTGLPEGSIVTFNGVPLLLSYVGGSGFNDVTLTTLQETVKIGAVYAANIFDFGNPTSVPTQLTATTVVSGAVSYTDLDRVQLTLPAGKTVTAASAVLTNVTGATGGATNAPGIIEFRDAGGTFLSSTNFTADGTLASLNLPAAPITNSFLLTMVSPVSTGPTAGTATYVITLTIGDVGGGGVPTPVQTVVGDVISGGSAPDATGADSGLDFDLLTRGGYIAENGMLAFPGELTGPGVDGTNFKGYWKHDNISLKLLARTGDPAPETGATAARFADLPLIPAINDDGQVTLFASLATNPLSTPPTTLDNDTGLWSELGGTGFQILIREGDVIPGLAGEQVGDLGWGCFATARTGPSTGEAAFALTFKGTSTDTALLRASITGPTVTAIGLLARQGAAAPGAGGATFTDLNSTVTRAVRMDASGNLVFGAGLSDGRTGLWYQPVTGGAPVNAMLTGQAAPGTTGATFAALDLPNMGSAGTFAFRGVLNPDGDNSANDRNDGIWRGTAAGGFTNILRRGDAALPGMPVGSKLGNIYNGWLNNSNHGAWLGWVDTAGDGINPYPADTFGVYTDIGGTMRLLTASGQPAPGIAGASFYFIDHPVCGGLSPNEALAFIATVSGGGTTTANNKGIWRSLNGAAPVLVIRTGDAMTTSEGPKTIGDIDIPGSGYPDHIWETPVMDQNGRLLVFITFTDGSSSQVIVP